MDNLKTYEEFNYIPKDRDRKLQDRELLKLNAMDERGIFIDMEKDILKKYGFVIKENTHGIEKPSFIKKHFSKFKEKEYLKDMKFGYNIKNCEQVAESKVGDYTILFWKNAEKPHNFVAYFYFILDEDDNLLYKGVDSGSVYGRGDKDPTDTTKKNAIKNLLEKIYFELMELGVEIKDPKADVDPYGEENWDE